MGTRPSLLAKCCKTLGDIIINIVIDANHKYICSIYGIMWDTPNHSYYGNHLKSLKHSIVMGVSQKRWRVDWENPHLEMDDD